MKWDMKDLKKAIRESDVEIIHDFGGWGGGIKDPEEIWEEIQREKEARGEPRTKFNNNKVGEFDSQKEMIRYKHLEHMERAGEISGLEVHPTFELLPAFEDQWGKRHRAITYTADFKYVRDGVTIIEDVKGGKATQTQAWRIKWKLAIHKYPEFKFEVVE